MMTRSVEAYHKKIVPEWMHEDALRSPHAVPQLLKITLNMGVKEAATDRKVIPKILDDLTLIAGQRPVITRARKSIAGFKIRAGMVVGFRVTLRRARMYAFFDRLIHIVLPRVRDFRGLSHRSFDGRGNYAFGLREQIVFPEIDYDKIDRLRGLDVVVTTNARSDELARRLLVKLGLPIRESGAPTTSSITTQEQ